MDIIIQFSFQIANPEGSRVRQFQDWWQRWLSVIPPTFLVGRGVFQGQTQQINFTLR
jgi:hypothetical protein